MTEFASNLEIGDFYVEYARTLLGEGDVSLQWVPAFQEVRRDRHHIPQAHRVSGLTLKITVTLGNLDRYLSVLLDGETLRADSLDSSLWNQGGELNLYPVRAAGRKGFRFARAFPERAESGNAALAVNHSQLQFLIEPSSADGIYFTRFDSSERPVGLAARVLPSVSSLSRSLVQLLAAPLGATVDQTLFRGRFAPTGAPGYALFPKEMTLWSAREMHQADYVLAARFPLDDQDTAEDALAAAAAFLHGQEITLPGVGTAACEVRKLTLGAVASAGGRWMTDDELTFRILL